MYIYIDAREQNDILQLHAYSSPLELQNFVH